MLTPDDNTARIADAVRQAAHALPPGSRLPSVRQLMATHRAAPGTVQRAIAGLAAEGILEARPGRGTFVAAPAGGSLGGDLSWQEVALEGATTDAGGLDELLAPVGAGAVALSTGYVERGLQPVAALGAAMARAGRRPGAWDRPPLAGLPELRELFAREIGGAVAGHDVLISTGGQSALATIFRALGAPGQPVLVESPTYGGAVAAARAAGLRPVPVPVDGDGLRPELLAEAFARTGARLLYAQPLAANPHGASLAPARREAVMQALAAAGAFLVEDDWARDLFLDGAPPPPLATEDPDGHVVHLRSLTKSAAPSLRIAAITARGVAGSRLRSARLVDDFFVSGPLQHAALDLLASAAWRTHLRRLRAGLTERRDVLLTALAREAPGVEPVCVPRGGLHVWARLPAGTDDVALARSAADAGVVVSPGRRWFVGEPPGPFLRLTFAGEPPERIAEGVARLASVL